MKKVELLAPAGDLERLKVNLLYGADAVYIGGEKYGLRANATNFSLSEIKEGCEFAHAQGKKVYLTLNIVFHDEDMEGVEDYIREVVAAGIDAFIVSDPFLISHIKTNYPNVEVHLSTQNSTTNTLAVTFFQNEGVDRVVLARELKFLFMGRCVLVLVGDAHYPIMLLVEMQIVVDVLRFVALLLIQNMMFLLLLLRRI